MLIPLLSCVSSQVSNKNAASFISVHHHYGDNTLQLRGTHASEQPAENKKKTYSLFLHAEKIPVHGESLDVGRDLITSLGDFLR
jgi:hypothetical protein